MISDEKRREVARKLRTGAGFMRENAKWYEYDLDAVACGNRAYRNIAAAVEDYGNSINGNYLHIMETLADLIDRPTCKMVREGEGFRCSACGTFHDMSGFAEFPWPYCPNCGAEVV